MLNKHSEIHTGDRLQSFPRLTSLLKTMTKEDTSKQALVFTSELETLVRDIDGDDEY